MLAYLQDKEIEACKSGYYNLRYASKKDEERKAMIYAFDIDDLMLMSLLPHCCDHCKN